jgi:parvulin-like peptidyl-prolyl isomerase
MQRRRPPREAGTAGLFLIRPTERTEADREAWAAQKDQQRRLEMMRAQQALLSRWMEDLRARANVEDWRGQVLNRRAA